MEQYEHIVLIVKQSQHLELIKLKKNKLKVILSHIFMKVLLWGIADTLSAEVEIYKKILEKELEKINLKNLQKQ